MRDAMAPPDVPDGPAWPANKAVYPTSLRRYLECPHRCRLEYVDRVPVPEPAWDPVLEKGNALHKLMERHAWNIWKQRQSSINEKLFVGYRLPAMRYPSQEQRNRDIREVLEWSQSALAYLTGQPTEFLCVEFYKPRVWERSSHPNPLRIGAKADVVVKRRDHIGAYIEIIDYKTGKNREFTGLTPLLSRIALRDLLHLHLPDGEHPRSIFTYLWLESGEIQRIELEWGYLLGQWNVIGKQIDTMLAERTWPMRPSRRCRWCPYFNTACSPDLRGT